MTGNTFDRAGPGSSAAATVGRARRERGRTSYLAGLAAEDIVARHYESRDCIELARRWRGNGGEIDLICRDGAAFVFVEIKKSATFERAQALYTRRQSERIIAAAQEYLGARTGGLLSQMRLDLALVDATGQVKVIRNAVWFD